MNVEKIIEKMKNQPNGISFEEAKKVLEHFGYTFKSQTGSHCHFKKEGLPKLTIPKQAPLKKVYIYMILSKLKLN